MADHTCGQDKRNKKRKIPMRKLGEEEHLEELVLDTAYRMRRGAHRFLGGNPERKRPLERLRLR